ncbi:hypothetical protein Ddc_21755 [Ditylenchus destructor]|nr:hypothetical protein Ddc_21755 [Ditylenchus destructor]
MVNSSNPIPSEMEYVKYLNLGFNIVIVACHVTTILFTFQVIYCSKFGKKSTKLNRISNSFAIFLTSRGFGAILATPYFVYLTVYWSAEGGRNYEPYAHLWAGLFRVTVVRVSSQVEKKRRTQPTNQRTRDARKEEERDATAPAARVTQPAGCVQHARVPLSLIGWLASSGDSKLELR